MKLQSADSSQHWDEFVAIYHSVIYRTARKQGLGHEDASEVTQEVLTRVTKSIDRWEHDPQRGQFRGWLYRITKNLSIDFLRKANRRPMTGRDSELFKSIEDKHGRDNEFDRQLERQIFRLVANRIQGQFKPHTWQAFWQTAVEARPVEEVAAELGLSRGAVYIARSRIMARLKQEVQNTLNETVN